MECSWTLLNLMDQLDKATRLGTLSVTQSENVLSSLKQALIVELRNLFWTFPLQNTQVLDYHVGTILQSDELEDISAYVRILHSNYSIEQIYTKLHSINTNYNMHSLLPSNNSIDSYSSNISRSSVSKLSSSSVGSNTTQSVSPISLKIHSLDMTESTMSPKSSSDVESKFLEDNSKNTDNSINPDQQQFLKKKKKGLSNFPSSFILAPNTLLKSNSLQNDPFIAAVTLLARTMNLSLENPPKSPPEEIPPSTSNTKTHRAMKGVSFDRSKKNWEASWLDARTGRRVKKCFSEGRWGSSARELAIMARKEAETSGVVFMRNSHTDYSKKKRVCDTLNSSEVKKKCVSKNEDYLTRYSSPPKKLNLPVLLPHSSKNSSFPSNETLLFVNKLLKRRS